MTNTSDESVVALPTVAGTSPGPTYDCIVLGGGGAAGAFGAGAVLALARYRNLKNLSNPLCYIGASAGALNAAVLASSTRKPLDLVGLWRSVRSRDVLGLPGGPLYLTVPLGAIRGKIASLFGLNFSVFRTKRLSKLIATHVDEGPDANSHLIVAATNLTTGMPMAFYAGKLFEGFLSHDQKQVTQLRRLGHLRAIHSKTRPLRAVLRASSSIPLAFPPVELDGELFVDGGVGNNVPTKESALFLRFLEATNMGRAGITYVVRMSEDLSPLERGRSHRARGLAWRTYETFQALNTRRTLEAWSQISNSVMRQQDKLKDFEAWLRGVAGVSSEVQEKIMAEASRLASLGSGTSRLSLKQIDIRPASSLGSTLSFDPAQIDAAIRSGYAQTLLTLEHQNLIQKHEHTELSGLDPFSQSARD